MTSVSSGEAIRLSAVIPNFNHGAYVADAVRAIAEQTPPPDEIIVVDDASTDDSLAVLERLAASCPRLRVVALDRNGGAIHALNRGLREARGDYVYFGAADDLTKPGLFKATLDMAARHPEAAFASAEAEIMDMDTGSVGRRPPVRPSHHARHFTPHEVAGIFQRIDNWILTGTAVIRRDLFLEAGGFDHRLGPLADGYALRRLAFVHGCCFVPLSGLVWQVRASGLSRSQAAAPEAGLKMLDTALGMMRADSAFPPWYPPLFERRFRFAVSYLAAQAKPMNRSVLTRVGARGPAGRAVLAGAATIGGPLGKIAALAWLSLRERPTSFAGLISTWFSRTRPQAGGEPTQGRQARDMAS